MHSSLRKGGKKEGEGIQLSFTDVTQKWHISHRLTAHWWELSHMAIPNYKGGCHM